MTEILHTLQWAAGIVVLPAALLIASPSAAEETLRSGKDNSAIFTASLENDYFAGEDNNYTNGVNFSFLSAENNLPGWIDRGADLLPFFPKEGRTRWGVAVGQSMYTPDDIAAPVPDPNDRPYAGWLYGSLGVISDTGYRLDNLQLTLGMVGPASGADKTQKFVHSAIDYIYPRGWDYQIHNEPGVVLTYERKWRGLYEFSPFGWGVDITPSLGGSVGNIFTHAAAGTVVRLGYDLPSDYGPPLIRPNLPGSDFFVPSKDFGWYLFAGVEGRAVARNIFLDGNSFQDSPSVDKLPFVGGLQAGIAFTFMDTRIAYTHILRTKEFHGQKENDMFGAFTVSWRF